VSQQGRQAIERRIVRGSGRAPRESGFDGVETCQLQAVNQFGIERRHESIVGVSPRSMEVDPAETTTTIAVNSIDLAVAISQALQRAGLNNKQACAWMDIAPGLWSRQLQGDGHISFQRLLKLPIDFWSEFVPLLAEPIGLAVTHEDIADRALMQAAFALEELTRSVVQMRRSQRRAG
jgi:hypothetical protein